MEWGGVEIGRAEVPCTGPDCGCPVCAMIAPFRELPCDRCSQHPCRCDDYERQVNAIRHGDKEP